MAFNTTPFHGKTARVRKNTTMINYSADWNINTTCDMADSSSQGDIWKTGLPGMASWSGSATFHFVAGNTEQKALMDNIINAAPGTQLTDIKWVLDAQANQITGNVFLVGMAVKADKGSIVDVTFNFTGDGAPTLTSAGT